MTVNPSAGILLGVADLDQSRKEVTVSAGPVERVRLVLMPGVLAEDGLPDLLRHMADVPNNAVAPFKVRRRPIEGT